jgi:hypothetical protein
MDMDRKQTQARVDELLQERAAVESVLAGARATARDDLIAGKKPTGRLNELAERLELLDEALAELTERLSGHDDAEARKKRVAAIERARQLTSDRRRLAAEVDAALAGLARAWPAYVEAVRSTVGTVVQCGGDQTPLRRVSLNGGASDALAKALLAATGDMGLVRALAVQTNNRPEHGVSLASAEDRVIRSLDVELLRVKATSPMPNIARDAKQELERITQETDG